MGFGGKVIGKSIKRLDGFVKVTGKAMYTDDFLVRGLLHAKIFRSTIANGVVKKINVEKAQAFEGVVAVFTYEDVPKYPFPTAGHPYHPDPSHQDIADKYLLTNRPLFYGDEIAAVVAKTEYIAEQAIKLIEVEYEEFEPILNVHAALKDGASEIHKGYKNNILASNSYSFGDIEKAFSEDKKIFSSIVSTLTVQHCAMENHVAYAYMDENRKITIVSSTQIPHIVRRIVGQALGISWGKVRVIKPFVGGGFGSKQDVVIEPLVAFLSMQCDGRPVKIHYTREETFFSSRVRHAIHYELETAIDKEGRIIGRKMKALSDNGAYSSHGHAICAKGGKESKDLYKTQAMTFYGATIYTNKPIAGAMRAYGIPQAMFALESHIDDIAKKIEIDPVLFRLKNINRQNYVDSTIDIPLEGTNGLAECLETGAVKFNWQEKKARFKKIDNNKRYGVGVACFCYTCAVFPISMEIAGARIVMNEDSSVQLQIGATEIGQGSDTAFAQMVSETIGISIDKINVVTFQDTDVTPYDTGSYATRQTIVTGGAVKKAAESIKEKIFLQLKKMQSDIDTNNLEIIGDKIVNKTDGEIIISVKEVAMNACTDIMKAAPITADVTNLTKASAKTYGCTFTAVEVDIKIGKVKILEILNVHDSGTIINPDLATAQVHGGISMGLGYGLYEQMLFDSKGKPLNDNLLDYKLMTTMDTPDLNVEFIQTYDNRFPFGAKGIGEPPTVSPAVAIRNAVLDATNVGINKAPLTPQVLVEEFTKAGLIQGESNV